MKNWHIFRIIIVTTHVEIIDQQQWLRNLGTCWFKKAIIQRKKKL